MNFLNPFFLLGIIAVAVPVIIHLINLRRPQKVQFSTLSFLNELKKSTIRKIRIKQYLLMALRALAVLFLALALARPFLPPTLTGSSGSDSPKAVGIIIDNSPSMERVSARGPIIEQARQVAQTIIDGARQEDRFIVTNTNGEQSQVTLQSALRAQESIRNIETQNTGNFISETLSLVYERLEQAPIEQAIVYLITDGQKSQLQKLESFDIEQSSDTKQITFQLVELGNSEQQNLAISDLSLKSQMLSSGTPVTLGVTLENTGEVEAVNQYVSLEIRNRMSGQYQVELQPGESREYLFEIVPDQTGDIPGRIIIDGDEVTFDNSRYFVLRIPETRSVLLLSEDRAASKDFRSYLNPALEAARKTNTQITFTERTVQEVGQAELAGYDVIVLDGLKEIPEYWFNDLQRYIQNGKGLLFFPSEQGNVGNYNDFFELFNAGEYRNIIGEYASFKPAGEFDDLVEGHPILNELFEKEGDEQISLDLPELFFYYQYEPPENTGTYNILQSRSDEALLTEQRFGEGKVLISAFGSDPGWTNFPINPLFAPLYYRAVLYASSSEQGGLDQYTLGQRFEWEGSMQNLNVQIEKGEETVIPEVQGMPEGIQISYPAREWTPGILTISAGEEKRLIAVNQDIMESYFDTLPYTDLDNLLSKYVTINSAIDASEISENGLQEQLNAASFGKEIWNWFVWIALLLLVAEMLVSKLYKAENMN
ncbi:VWA domain-containing protein [Balneolaceae bacterium YR4-1]|uniref:VWA domain-containing protein n=1 Tax=Halalkalibaculum roseum TaxID=2709311 RepID=A0A6M1SYC5_9BACT|nr:BatA domain-containing protein [Halalkalibaculum roseum]NGP78080.1 VWA domain-containing protein [Halalkalibaculum roseum]